MSFLLVFEIYILCARSKMHLFVDEAPYGHAKLLSATEL